MFTQEELKAKTLDQLLEIYEQASKLANEKNQIEYFKMVRTFILENFVKKY